MILLLFQDHRSRVLWRDSIFGMLDIPVFLPRSISPGISTRHDLLRKNFTFYSFQVEIFHFRAIKVEWCIFTKRPFALGSIKILFLSATCWRLVRLLSPYLVSKKILFFLWILCDFFKAGVWFKFGSTIPRLRSRRYGACWSASRVLFGQSRSYQLSRRFDKTQWKHYWIYFFARYVPVADLFLRE